MYLYEGSDWKEHKRTPQTLTRDEWAGRLDLYATLHRFRRSGRTCDELTNLGGLWVDIDSHQNGREPSELLAEALERVRALHLPEPSLYTLSGRGVHLIWLHETLWATKNRLIWWTDTIRTLTRLLGGDMNAAKATQPLRVSGTWNTKARGHARAYLLSGTRYEFADIARRVAAHEACTGRRTAQASSTTAQEVCTAPSPVRWRRKYLAHLEDLERLKTLRGWVLSIPEGWRDRYLFAYGVCARQAFGSREGQERTYTLALSHTSWTEAEIQRHLSSAFTHRTRYQVRRDYLDELLEITSRERRLLDELRRDKRNAQRREAYRIERDRLSLPTQEQRAAETAARRERAHELREAGYTPSDIAHLLGVSRKTVQRYLRWKSLVQIQYGTSNQGIMSPGEQRRRSRVQIPYGTDNGGFNGQDAQTPITKNIIETNECPPVHEGGSGDSDTSPRNALISALNHAPWLPSPPPSPPVGDIPGAGRGVREGRLFWYAHPMPIFELGVEALTDQVIQHALTCRDRGLRAQRTRGIDRDVSHSVSIR